MPMRVEFTGNTADEMNEAVKDYASKIKGTRGGRSKDDADAQSGGAPAPLQPPQGGVAGFAPGGGGAPQGFNPTSFSPAGAQTVQGPSPEVAALVQRISTRIDGLIQQGQPAADVLKWFQGQCGAEAANATMDQIKAHFLYKLPQPSLEDMAKLIAA